MSPSSEQASTPPPVYLKWFDLWQPEVAQLPPIFQEAARRYMQCGRESQQLSCECRNGHCLEYAYWWPTQEILKWHLHTKFIRPGEFLRWMERMFATCRAMTDYHLQYHSQETEDRIAKAQENIVSIFQEIMEQAP